MLTKYDDIILAVLAAVGIFFFAAFFVEILLWLAFFFLGMACVHLLATFIVWITL